MRRWLAVAVAVAPLSILLRARAEEPASTPTGATPASVAPPASTTAAAPAAPPASAAPASAAPASTSEEVTPPWIVANGPGTWSTRYAEARDAMLAGRFADCRSGARALIDAAGTATERALATELAHVCGALAANDLIFVKRQDLGESTVAQRAAGIRTTDELVLLYSNSVLYGIGTGAWIAVLAEPREPAGVILPMLGISALSATFVWAADRGRGMPYGVPQSMVSGFHLGTLEGLAWTLWNQARSRRADLWEASTVASIVWGTATAGIVAGAVVGGAGTTPGRASFVESTGMWAGVVGGLFAAALYGKDDRNDGRDDAALLTGALALNAGAITGALLSRRVSPTIARVRFLDLGALAGGLVGGGLYLASVGRNGDFEPTAGFSLTALGVLAGGSLAWYLTTDMPRDEGPAKPSAVSFGPAVTPVKGGLTLGLSAVL